MKLESCQACTASLQTLAITGFSNSMTAAALESKSEGVILGIMANMFKLAGAIVVSGVVSALICSTIILLVR